MSISQAKIAIITVTYNSAAFIEQYLCSVSHFLNNSQHKLFIVDNSSQDTTCADVQRFIEKHQLSDHIQLIALSNNLGFGKGCNKGVEIAQAHSPSHLWFLNPDTTIFDNSGQALLHTLETQPNAQFAGSILVNKHMEPRAGAFRFPKLANVALSTLRLGLLDKLFAQYTTAAPIEEHPYRTDWLTGASFMVKNETFLQLDGFDPFYFLYYEEVDLFLRAKKHRFSAWACPDSQVFHISGASTGINNPNSIIKRRPSYWFESRRHFYISNFGRLYFAAIDVTFVVSHTIWKVRATLQGKKDDTPPHFIRDLLSYSCFCNPFRST